jgi:SpoVK/Ycf46/Vps4 family AAA+-type ATPase
LDPSANLTLIAEKLDGYTGSDIKEVCHEAVIQISHEQAQMLDQQGLFIGINNVTKTKTARPVLVVEQL